MADIDERLEQAAARPVIFPEMIVVDHDKVFQSASFEQACRSLVIHVQDTHKGFPWEKGGVERSFDSLDSLFCQYVAGFVGRSVEHRGTEEACEAKWTLPQLQEPLEEWSAIAWGACSYDAKARVVVTAEESWIDPFPDRSRGRGRAPGSTKP
jgi:hypothetical protein